MRNIPVDVSALTFVCVSPPRPKLVNQETGEVKTDRNGQTVFTVGLSAADASGRVDLLNVAVVGDQSVTIGEVVTPVGLVAFPWEAVLGGEKRWGVAYRADRIAPVSSAAPSSPSSAFSSGSSDASASAGVA
ncbi:SCO3933 family regulatory protein [Actinomadura geliboluensis]|uniref:SCO3933 family regulatory protein n=1 Tax=Actinomadura geliboluensis TaxID=882440 RepID=UPI00371DBE3C